MVKKDNLLAFWFLDSVVFVGIGFLIVVLLAIFMLQLDSVSRVERGMESFLWLVNSGLIIYYLIVAYIALWKKTMGALGDARKGKFHFGSFKKITLERLRSLSFLIVIQLGFLIVREFDAKDLAIALLFDLYYISLGYFVELYVRLLSKLSPRQISRIGRWGKGLFGG